MIKIDIPSKIIKAKDDGTQDVYLVHEKIGQGGFSVVHRVTDERSNKSYAMKIIPKDRYSNDEMILSKIQNESSIQSKLNHPNIVKSISTFSDERNHYIVLEYCPGKSLCDYLKTVKCLNEKETRKILRDVLRGIFYLHNNKIIHHDLKLENFLIANDGRVKIADFGVSTALKNFNDKCFSICGTTNYMSPELLQKENNGHSFGVDIWAIGVSTFLLLTGQYPFGGFENDFIYEKAKNRDYNLPQKVHLSPEAKSFIDSIFTVDPNRRPKAIDLLKHPFMTKGDIEKVQVLKSNSIKPIQKDASDSLKKFSYEKVLYGKENDMLNGFNFDLKKNFIIPNHFVVKYSFYFDDLGYLLGDGTVGVCFSDHSRIVIDPNEIFIQYYHNYNSKEEVIVLNDQFNFLQKNRLQKKISIVQKFSRDFKKFGFSYNSTNLNYDPRIPLYHVKYYVVKNNSILFKLNNKNIQMNCSDHKKLIIFYNSKKMCLVNYLKERCTLLNINDVAKNRNCEEYIRLKESKELAHSIYQQI